MAYLIEAQNLVIKNGTITAPERAIHVVDGNLTLNNVKINAVERCIGAYNDCVVTVDKDCVLTTSGDDVCVMMYSDAGRTEAVTELDLDGTVQCTGDTEGTWAISGNGTKNHGSTLINITENGVVKSKAESAIYHPQKGVITLDGGTIEGKDGVYMKSGKMVVNSGTVIGNGDADTTYEYSGDGTKTPLGHGIVVEFTNYPGGLAELDVNGGTIKSENKSAIGYYVSPKCEEQDLDVLKSTHVSIGSATLIPQE